jgi:thiol:disulfide interchange protein DsbD
MDLLPTWNGSPLKLPQVDRSAAVGWNRTLALVALTIASLSGVADAQTKLLEPERAFALSVQALDDKTIEARFAIADGYFLYREKLKFNVEPVALAAAPVLPPGKVKDDPFFGRVETYRGQLAVKLALGQNEPGRKVTVRAESQGCADAGICYPPQVQVLTLTLPMSGAGPGAPVAATPARKSWFN